MFQKFIQVGLYLRGRYNTGKGGGGVAYIRDVKWVTYFWGVYSWGLMYRGRINRILRYIYIDIYIYSRSSLLIHKRYLCRSLSIDF